MLDRGRRGWRHLLVRVVEHRQVVFRDCARLRITPVAPGVLVQRLAEELALAVGQPVDIAWADALDGEPGAGLHDDFERGASEPVEQQAAEWLEPRVARKPETDQELQLTLRLQVGAAGAAGGPVPANREGLLVRVG